MAAASVTVECSAAKVRALEHQCRQPESERGLTVGVCGKEVFGGTGKVKLGLGEGTVCILLARQG